MCFVGLGFVCCDSRLGRDPLVKGNNGVKVGKSGICNHCCALCSAPVIIALVNALIYHKSPEIFWPLFIFGCLIILICICRIGQSYIVIDRVNHNLIKSIGGCCWIAYRRQIISSLSDVERFYVTDAPGIKIDSEPAMNLFVGLKQNKSVNLVQAEKTSVVMKKATLQTWWNTHDALSDYNVRFEWSQNLWGSINQHINYNPPLYTVDDEAKDEREFQQFVVKIKLRNMEKGKMIDMAYELDKEQMINEYQLLKRLNDGLLVGSPQITEGKMIELLLDKADTILKTRNINVAINME